MVPIIVKSNIFLNLLKHKNERTDDLANVSTELIGNKCLFNRRSS